MGEFGWAYISGSAPLQSAGGISGSIQFATDTGNIDGSSRFVYKNQINVLELTGTLKIVGDITASNYVIENVSQINSAGSSQFGNSSDDTHQYTGSIHIQGPMGITGSVAATSFIGDGSQLTSLPIGVLATYASGQQYRIITSTAANGIQGEANLIWQASNLKITGSTWISNILSGSDLRGDGQNVDNLSATKITHGTLDNARLPSAISVTSLTGDGSGLTTLNASNISAGTIANTYLPTIDNSKLPSRISVARITGSIELSGSAIYGKTATFSQDLIVRGTLTANNLNVTTTGDTIFGDNSADEHQFTGSVYFAGPISASTGLSASVLIGDGAQITGLPPYGSPAIGYFNNGAQYRLVTAVNADTVQGESNLLWKSNNLRVTGSVLVTNDVNAVNFHATTRVGIGTTSPTTALDVDGAIFISNLKTIGRDNGTTRKANIQFGDVSPLGNSIISFRDGGNDLMVVDGSGKVGIGTTSPSDKLTVVGAISGSTFYGDGSSLTGIGGTGIGAAEDGSYTDGLFTDFDTDTTVGTAVDRFNEVLKALAPSPAPVLDDIDCDDSGATGKLSFGAAGAVSGYTNVGTAAGFSAVDVNGSYTVTSANNNLRRGLFGGAVTINGDLNEDISSDGSYPNYPANSFGNANQGTLKLKVNGAQIHSIDLTNTAGSGVPGSGAGSYLNGNGSGFYNLSQIASAHFTDGTGLDVFKHRTGKWKVHPDDQRDGWNYAQVVHTIGSDTITNYIEWVNDSNSNALAESNAALGSLSMTGETTLSGVKYFTGGTATYSVNVANAYRNTYSSTNISFTTTRCTVPSQAMPSIGGGEDETKSLAITGTATINVSSLLDSTIQARAVISHPLKSNLTTTQRTISNILLYTYSDNSTNVSETFRGESYRLTSGNYTNQSDAVSGNAWNSATSLVGVNGLMFYNLALRSPLQGANGGNFSTLTNGPGSNVNYSSITGTRTFYRKFQNTSGGSKTGVSLIIQGSGTIVPSGGTLNTANIKVFIKLPNTSNSQTTGWMDLATAFSTGQTGDNDGCLEGSLDNSLNATNSATFGTVYVGDDDWIVVKIEADESWTGNISSMSVSWA